MIRFIVKENGQVDVDLESIEDTLHYLQNKRRIGVSKATRAVNKAIGGLPAPLFVDNQKLEVFSVKDW